MTDSRAAVGLDRLPWLSDEPRPPRKPAARELLGWIVAAIILVAGVSYWLGTRSAEQQAGGAPEAQPSTTFALPEARPPAQPTVKAPAMPEVEPIVAPPMPVIDEPAPVKRRAAPASRHKQAVAERPTEPAKAPAKTAPRAKKSSGPPIWPVRAVEGASGRMVRIGTFRTAHQAKKGWWAVMRLYPAMQRLPALVVPVQSLRDGRVYYRLQMGTTSQAHSEILCQRMRMIHQSCVVIGLSEEIAM